ncbi:MAG: oxidoreductase domain protein [Deltaproteobacteria bacterium]|nr:oxidoreductase domain protein [Deltaproteobacteria bacterium]
MIGAGAWGLNHVRVIAAEPRCELAAVVDPDLAAIDRVRALAPQASIYRDPEHAFADASIDAIVVATPAPTHAPLACGALAAGKHVLVEKPLALSLDEAREIERAAGLSGKVVLVGHLMLFHPAVVRLRELVRSDALGRLHYVHSTRANLGRLRRDENALWSFGPHELSMLDYLLELTPTTVAAHGACVLQPGIEDVVFLTMRYPGGELAHLHLSWLHPRKERTLTLVCSRKMVEFDDVAPDKLRIYDKGYDRPPNFTNFAEYLTLRDGDVHIPQLPMAEPLRVQLQHFVDCILGEASPIADLASGMRTVQILEAAQKSLRSNGVPVDLKA